MVKRHITTTGSTVNSHYSMWFGIDEYQNMYNKMYPHLYVSNIHNKLQHEYSILTTHLNKFIEEFE